MYQKIMLTKADEVESLNQDEILKKRFEQRKLMHPKIDFFLPHDFGGLGETVDPKYTQVNVFSDTRDLPVIKPRTTIQCKNEFNIKIEKTENVKTTADMSLFKKTVKEFEE